LTIAYLTTLAEDAVHATCFHTKVILCGSKETGNLPRGRSLQFLCHVSLASCWYGWR
jgi:hypothetical protein